MEQNQDFIGNYDDTNAVAYIREQLRNAFGEEECKKISEDDLYYLIDVIYDYLASNDLILTEEETDDEEIEVDVDDVIDYIEEAAKTDNMGPYDREILAEVVLAENDYSESLQD